MINGFSMQITLCFRWNNVIRDGAIPAKEANEAIKEFIFSIKQYRQSGIDFFQAGSAKISLNLWK